MMAEDAAGLRQMLERMHGEMEGVRAWLEAQPLERGLTRLPVQAMRAAHQIDEMLASVRRHGGQGGGAGSFLAELEKQESDRRAGGR